MRINTNVASMTAQESAANVNKALNSSLEKLSSGLRINKASDDASGMAIADKLRTQASALGQSISNANSGNALVQIADKAMAEQSNILDIVKTKLIQAATETTSSEGRESIRKDIAKLLGQFDNIASQTNYNGINLLDTKGQSFTFQVGEDKTYDISVETAYASNTSGIGGGSNAYTAGATLDATDSTIAVKLSDTTAGPISISGVNTTPGALAANATIEVSGTNVTSMTLSSSLAGAVTLTTTDANMIDVLESMKTTSTNLTSTVVGTYTLTQSVANTDTTLTFGAGIDLSKLQISGLAMGTTADGAEKIKFATVDTLSIKRTDENVDDTVGSKDLTVDSTTSGKLVGGQLLSSLKDLDADGLTAEVANSFMSSIDEALSQLNSVRSDFGSTQNQLDSFIRNAMTTQTNIKAAESVIRDVDYAAESANFNKQNIVAQAGTYALSQANTIQQNVLRLLQ